jgi:signal transduction histidine kinase/ActR/RegA family two-component response regulator
LTEALPFRYRRVFLSYVAILFVFLGIVSAAIVSHERDMIGSARRNAARELALIGTVSREALLKHDYQTVEQFLRQWGAEHADVVSVTATAPNGFVLGRYDRAEPSRSTFNLREPVRYGGRELVVLEMVRDFEPTRKNLVRFASRLIMSSVLLTAALGVALWLTVRRMALKPLEAEVERRRLAEEALKEAHSGLELRVQERTAELKEERDRAHSAEDEVKSLFSTLHTLVEHMPEGVLLLDAEDRIAIANPVGARYMEELSGVRQGEALKEIGGRPIRDLLISPPLIMWHDVKKDGKTFEVAGRRIDARGMVFAVRDVTEERAIKDRIQMHERLAAVGQLAAGIAHDFNNILTVINGYAEMLAERELPEDLRQPIDFIGQSGKRAADLIGQILDFSRKTVGELKPLDLGPFIREFIRFVGRTLPEDIRITLDAPGECVVLADPTKMQQVLANLIVNARDAMPEGGELKISLERMSLGPRVKPPVPTLPSGEWVALSVSDTGTGIAPDVLPHIFEPFYTTKAAGRGAGLGLSQVYGIVKQHGGLVDVRTELGVGSSFIVYLPAVTEAVSPAPTEEEAEAPRGRGETILVVEDEKAVLSLVENMLTGLGYRVIGAGNGEEALRVFEERASEIALVITDLVMPEMGGVELAMEIKKRKPELGMIAMSGYPLAKEEEFKKAGFSAFIRKPFKIQALAEVVGKAVSSPP